MTNESLLKLQRVVDLLKYVVSDEEFDFKTMLLRTDCGTVGCAAGWYWWYTYPAQCNFCDGALSLLHKDLEKEFQLTHEEVTDLFYRGHLSDKVYTKREIIKRFERFIKDATCSDTKN